MDTLNDGSELTFKAVPSLYHLADTAPWTWHGWQTDLTAAVKKSLTDTMLGPEPTAEDAAALIEFFRSLEPPPNPYRQGDGRCLPPPCGAGKSSKAKRPVRGLPQQSAFHRRPNSRRGHQWQE